MQRLFLSNWQNEKYPSIYYYISWINFPYLRKLWVFFCFVPFPSIGRFLNCILSLTSRLNILSEFTSERLQLASVDFKSNSQTFDFAHFVSEKVICVMPFEEEALANFCKIQNVNKIFIISRRVYKLLASCHAILKLKSY